MDLLESTLVEQDTETLFTVTRQRIIEGILTAVKSPYKVLLLDKDATKIISAVLEMTDLTTAGISLVENVEIDRQPLPKMEALYFVAPTSKNIDRIIKDWEDPDSPPYAHAHIFVTSRLEDRLLEKLAHSNAYKKIKTLREVNIDFLVAERRVFNFNMPDAFNDLYSPTSTNTKTSQMIIARKLITLCCTLNEYPIIRYSKSHPHCALIAQLVADGLDELRRAGALDTTGERGQLVIIDRTHDLITPLVHEFTYQAMCTDLLDISTKYVHEYKTASGEEVEKEVLLDDRDPIWVTMSHMHIEHARKWVSSTVKEFLAKSKAAQVQRGQLKEDKSLKQISDVIKSLPKFQKLYSKFSLHISLAKKCMDEFTSRNLEKLCAAEQDVATGVTDSGKKLDNSQLADVVLQAIQDPGITKEDRLRLILLYMASLDKEDPKTKRVLANAMLTAEEEELVSNIVFLKNATSRKNQRRAPGKEEWEFVLSRYFPAVRDIFEDMAGGKLNSKDFPYVNPDEEGSGATATSTSRSRRKKDAATEAKWGGKGTPTTKPRETTKRPTRLIIFVAGGVTYTEMREAYTCSKGYKVDCIIGGTSIIKPREFIELVRCLKEPSRV